MWGNLTLGKAVFVLRPVALVVFVGIRSDLSGGTERSFIALRQDDDIGARTHLPDQTEGTLARARTLEGALVCSGR